MDEIQQPENFLTDEIKNLLKKEDSVKSVEPVEVKPNLIKDGSEFWSKRGSDLVKSYDRGEMISNYNSVSEFDHLSVFHSLTRIFYEIIREELIKKEINTHTIKECFQLIDTSFSVLSQQLQNELSSNQKNKEETVDTIDVNLIFSGIHGFINSYLERKNID